MWAFEAMCAGALRARVTHRRCAPPVPYHGGVHRPGPWIVVALIAAIGAAGLSLGVPRPSAVAEGGRAYLRWSCADLAAAIQRASETSAPQGGIIEPSRAWIDERDPSISHLACGDVEVRVRGLNILASPDVQVRGRSFTAIDVLPDGSARILQTCLACDDPKYATPISHARVTAMLAHALSGLLAALAVAGARRAWSLRAPRLRDLRALFTVAPDTFAPESAAAAVRVRLHPLRGGALVEVEHETPTLGVVEGGIAPVAKTATPRLELSHEGGYRRAEHAEPPTLFGPGEVNGLPVAAGARAVVDDGDVVRLHGAPAFTARFPELDRRLIRYHRAPGGELRFLRRIDEPMARTLWTGAALGIAASVVLDGRAVALLAPLASLIVFGFSCPVIAFTRQPGEAPLPRPLGSSPELDALREAIHAESLRLTAPPEAQSSRRAPS